MEWLRTTFLEEPTAVYVTLAVALLVLAAVWYERRTRRMALLLIVPVALAGAVFAVEQMVVTDVERIEAAAADIADGIVRGDADAILRHLDGSFTADLPRVPHLPRRQITKADIPGILRTTRSSYAVVRITFTKMRVDVTGRRARMHVATLIQIADTKAPCIWDILWIKTPNGWLIENVAEPKQGVEF